MNVVYLSPHFPPNYRLFCIRLREEGANVLGIAEAPYEALRPDLRAALTEYYRVDTMEEYDRLLRACGHFVHRHGRIDRIESHNEHWLVPEARLRTDFNVPGPRADRIEDVKRKSRMKAIFSGAGIAVARGRVARTLAEAAAFASEVSYPLIAKPDIGVGAAATFRIDSRGALERFFAAKPPADYILEEFIAGDIFSFDGLADREGKPAFFTAHGYSSGIMEIVNADDDVFYWSMREIPADLETAGRAALAAFGIRERFFHFEFFRTRPEGRIVALEVNMRPPGGLTTDMFNFANDIDVYREWARLLVHGRFEARWSRPWHVCYVGRKRGKAYRRSHEEVLAAWGARICRHEPIDSIFRQAIGDYGYLVRSADLDEVLAAARFIQEK